MLAFHNDPETKKKYIDRVHAHQLADRLVKGTGWDNGKGCAVGCTLEKYDHTSYETELGISCHLAGLEDAIFEGLPNELAQKWPEQFLQSITPGADLSRVFHQFIVWLLIDPVDGVIRFNNHESIRHVAELHAQAASGIMPSTNSWSAAESAAWSAAASAAEFAARSAAESAAWSATGFIAEFAARSAARSAAWSAAYVKQSEKLLELLRAVK